MKRLSDLTSYKGVLPYASEMFGIYQPLLAGSPIGCASAWQRERNHLALESEREPQLTGNHAEPDPFAAGHAFGIGVQERHGPARQTFSRPGDDARGARCAEHRAHSRLARHQQVCPSRGSATPRRRRFGRDA
jgi:hypothetical protein